MANSLPFNAVAVDGEYDRVYKAEDWAWYFATFIANGIFPKPSDGLQVVAYSGMEIRVNAGYAFINGYAFRNPATLSVTLDTAEGALNRVDRVVVRWDLPQRDMYIAVLKGTPSAKPTATAVTRTTEIWELALADIYVGKGVTRIQTQNITDQRFNSAVCGIVTGTVEEIDASVLTKQFTDFFNTYSAAVLDEFSAYKQSMEKYLTEITGVYDSYVSKTEGLFAQYESQFNERYSSFESTLDNWDKELLSAYTEFMAKIKLFQSDAENEFNTWFESIKDKLGEDIAGSLQLQIEELAAAMQEVKKQAEAGTKETKEAIAALDERLKRVESQTIPSTGSKPNQLTAACAMHLSPDEKHLFCSNAGDNTVSMYDRDDETGMLTLRFCLPISGDYPKDIAIFPDGKHLASINHEGSISFFKIDYEKGLLVMSDRSITVNEPNCCEIVKIGD